MTTPFDRVVVRNVTTTPRNVWLAVHPFSLPRPHYSMDEKGEYGATFVGEEELPEAYRPLADRLWDAIPGLDSLIFNNGRIIIQHAGAFDDAEIVAAAEAVIRPWLEQELALRRMVGDESSG